MSYCTKAFGAYDIRGIYPQTINEEIAYRIGRFFPNLFKVCYTFISQIAWRFAKSFVLLQAVCARGYISTKVCALPHYNKVRVP